MKEITAKAIIAEAKKNGIYEGPMPDSTEKVIKDAQELADLAKQAWAENMRGPEVEMILKIEASDESVDEKPIDESIEKIPRPEEDIADQIREAEEATKSVEPWPGYDGEKVGEIKAQIDEKPSEELLDYIYEYESAHKNRSRLLEYVQQQKESSNEEGTDEVPSQEAPRESAEESRGSVSEEHSSVDADAPTNSGGEADESRSENRDGEHASESHKEVGSDPEYVELIKDVEDALERERLHIPAPLPPEDYPEIPFDLNDLSDSSLRSLHGAFGAYAYHAGYLLMKEEAKARRCKERADDLYRNLLAVAEKYDEYGKQKTMTVLEAEIESLPEVKKWRKRQRRFELQAHSYRAQRDAYLKEAEILSRQETMRHNDWERARR